MYIHGNCAVGMWLKPKGKFNLIDRTMASHLGYGKGMTGARAEVTKGNLYVLCVLYRTFLL